ncbi:hypothetical protein KL933_001608 [Ogataea haglerorum]|uniref:Uncharacterized protein n=1 Tax=Ogataea haglerorum TaxID=1937702 RepID=A0AAN6D7T1_9ASCO|nr:hypothetical protein KL933_001608 [Ogataea haglerorum]
MPYVVRMPISAAGMRERFLYMFICRRVIVGIPSQIIWQQNAAPAVAWPVKCWLEFSPSNTRRPVGPEDGVALLPETGPATDRTALASKTSY